MFGSYVRFKYNYAALRKSSDNQQQHLLIGQQWIIGNTMWIWLSTSSQRRILDFLRACFLRWWATLRHVHIQGWNTTKKTMTCDGWYHHSQPLQRSHVYTELSSHVSVPYLVRFYFYFGTNIIYLRWWISSHKKTWWYKCIQSIFSVWSIFSRYEIFVFSKSRLYTNML